MAFDADCMRLLLARPRVQKLLRDGVEAEVGKGVTEFQEMVDNVNEHAKFEPDELAQVLPGFKLMWDQARAANPELGEAPAFEMSAARKRLGNPMGTPEGARFVQAVDESREALKLPGMETFAAVQAQAELELSDPADYERDKDELIEISRTSMSPDPFTPVETVKARIIMDREWVEIANAKDFEPQAYADMTSLIDAYRRSGTAAGRSLAFRVGTPLNMIRDAITSPPLRTQREIEKLRKSGTVDGWKRAQELLDEWSFTLVNFKIQLQSLGVTMEQVTDLVAGPKNVHGQLIDPLPVLNFMKNVGIAKANKWDIMEEIYRAFLVSSPRTWGVNLVGGGLFGSWNKLIEKQFEVGINFGLNVLSKVSKSAGSKVKKVLGVRSAGAQPGDFIRSLAGVIEEAVTSPEGRKVRTGERTARLGRVDPLSPKTYLAVVKGIWASMSQGIRNGILGWRSETNLFMNSIGQENSGSAFLDDGRSDTRFAGPRVAIPGLTGRIIRGASQDFLIGGDEMLKTILTHAEVGNEAHRITVEEGVADEDVSSRINEIMSDYTSPAWAAAADSAKELTFTATKGPTAAIQRLVIKGRSASISDMSAGRIPLDLRPFFYAIPFVMTPLQIFYQAIGRRVPLIGAFEAGVKMLWNARGVESKVRTDKNIYFSKDGVTWVASPKAFHETSLRMATGGTNLNLDTEKGFRRLKRKPGGLDENFRPKDETSVVFDPDMSQLEWESALDKLLVEGAPFDVTPLLAQQVISIVGTAMLLWLNDEDDPWITGAAKHKRRAPGRELAFRLDKPMSIRVFGRDLSYANIEPVSTALAFMVDTINAYKRDDDVLPAAEDALIDQVNSKTFLQGISDILGVVRTEERERDIAKEKLLRNFILGWVPNLFKNAVRSTEDTIPERRVFGKGDERKKNFWKRILQETKIPFLGGPVFPKIDAWGNDVIAGNLIGGEVMARIILNNTPFFPTKVFKSTPFKADVLLDMWNKSVPPKDRVYLRTPRNSFTFRKVEFIISDADYTRFLRESGRMSFERVQKRIDSMDLFSPKGSDVLFIERVMKSSRRIVKTRPWFRALQKEAVENSKN